MDWSILELMGSKISHDTVESDIHDIHDSSTQHGFSSDAIRLIQLGCGETGKATIFKQWQRRFDPEVATMNYYHTGGNILDTHIGNLFCLFGLFIKWQRNHRWDYSISWEDMVCDMKTETNFRINFVYCISFKTITVIIMPMIDIKRIRIFTRR